MSEPLLCCRMEPAAARQKNPLVLAYLGDTVWDLMVRQKLAFSGEKVNALHRKAVLQVNAGAQAAAAEKLTPFLKQDEADIFQRGCNAHSKHNTPKNQDPVAYSSATGLEALFGYLYLTGQNERIMTLFSIAEDDGSCLKNSYM